MARHPMEQQTSEPVGKSVPRIDMYEKVTGTAIFADDMHAARAPGLLYGRLVRSPYAHALIKKVDASRALELPGVKAVVTGADVPKNIGLYLIDRPIFARDRVRYVGEPVAGVVASTEEIAEEARELEVPRPSTDLEGDDVPTVTPPPVSPDDADRDGLERF